MRHRAAIRAAARRCKARSIALVGSTARGEDADGSDYDFLVGFEDDADLFDLAGLQVDLEELLGDAVDVIDASAVREGHFAMFEDAMVL
ncbi:MAG: nucleotidyltransferase domain-containing protein [Acidimicrobiaceae bacterium]|nr:nucleotidyltransferase domain-containing protein [Acidimicrobiaceae bacterium]